jgi:hypothetical protein
MVGVVVFIFISYGVTQKHSDRSYLGNRNDSKSGQELGFINVEEIDKK